MSSNKAAADLDTHHLLLLKEVPDTLIALREELAYHPEIYTYASLGGTFEECLGRIGVKLDIVLDGDYEVGELCGVLLTALRNIRFGKHAHTGMSAVFTNSEIVETAETLTLKEVIKGETTLIPKDAILVESTPRSNQSSSYASSSNERSTGKKLPAGETNGNAGASSSSVRQSKNLLN